MSDESGGTATQTTPPETSPVTSTTAGAPAKQRSRRGPRKESEIRAQVEAEMRDKIRAEIEAEVEAERIRLTQANPITGADITDDPKAPDAVTIHFVEDGVTLLGKVWYRGEELSVRRDSQNWKDSLLANGRSFFTLTEDEQIATYGKRLFRPGPWRGKRLDEIDDSLLTEAEREQLRRAARDRDRRFGVPTS